LSKLKHAKTLYRKAVRVNAYGDNFLFTKQHFPRAQTEERRELEIGLIFVKATSSKRLGEREISRRLGPGNSSKEGLQTKPKDHHNFSTPTRAQSSFIMSLIACSTYQPENKSRSHIFFQVF
jgi:hypothetical protein